MLKTYNTNNMQREEEQQAQHKPIAPLPGLDEPQTRLLLQLLALAAPSGGTAGLQSLDDAGLRALLLVQLAVVGCQDPPAADSAQQRSPSSSKRLPATQGAWAPPATPSVRNLQSSSVLSFSDLSSIPPRTVNAAGACGRACAVPAGQQKTCIAVCCTGTWSAYAFGGGCVIHCTQYTNQLHVWVYHHGHHSDKHAS